MEAVLCDGLRKRYGKRHDKPALDGLDLAVPTGTVHGLLGPNGAGKTTAIRILTTLLRPDCGRATVAGIDVLAHPAEVRQRIGLVGQQPAVDEILCGRQNLEMFGHLAHLGARAARNRARELLDQFGLTETEDKPVSQYSGGMRRRLDLAVGFIVAPQVLFLDEPTTGLDPRNRNQVWEIIRGLVAAGTTVLLTTQYLEEADRLADGISVIDNGRVIAAGTPDQLKAERGGDRIDVVLHSSTDLTTAAKAIHARLTAAAIHTGLVAEPTIDHDTRLLSTPVTDRVNALAEITQALNDNDIAVDDIALRRPTLDEVFLHLTRNRA